MISIDLPFNSHPSDRQTALKDRRDRLSHWFSFSAAAPTNSGFSPNQGSCLHKLFCRLNKTQSIRDWKLADLILLQSCTEKQQLKCQLHIKANTEHTVNNKKNQKSRSRLYIMFVSIFQFNPVLGRCFSETALIINQSSFPSVGGDQNSAKREVNIGFAFFRWPETRLKMNTSVAPYLLDV